MRWAKRRATAAAYCHHRAARDFRARGRLHHSDEHDDSLPPSLLCSLRAGAAAARRRLGRPRRRAVDHGRPAAARASRRRAWTARCGIFRRLGVDRAARVGFLEPDWRRRAVAQQAGRLRRQEPRTIRATPGRRSTAWWARRVRHGLKVMISISMPAPIWATGQTRTPNPLWKPSVPSSPTSPRPSPRRYAALADHYGDLQRAQPGRLAPAPERPQGPVRAAPLPGHGARRRTRASRRSTPARSCSWASSRPAAARGRGAEREHPAADLLRAMACRDTALPPDAPRPLQGLQADPADAIGHHPYQLLTSPFMRSTQPRRRRDQRQPQAAADDRPPHPPARVPPGPGRRLNVYYTEFGYQTSPPDPFAGVSLAPSAASSSRRPTWSGAAPGSRRSTSSGSPTAAIVGSGARRFEEFQSGLLFRNRRKKPAYRRLLEPVRDHRQPVLGPGAPRRLHTVRVEHKRTAAAATGSWPRC